ncbi:uncharacterized protein V1518DRAFT_415055 [Limtongia smithiae]|uniref:uncharacterized protein n=1 Tax=Limtongia smithiae TaxID=1125753 RepID=UPI0034CE8374
MAAMDGKLYCRLLHRALTDLNIKAVEILASPPSLSDNGVDDTYDRAYLPLLVVTSEHVVGVPKNILFTAFEYAHNAFYERVRQTTGITVTDEDDDEIDCTSLVLLLVASENLTAVNARKRRLQHPAPRFQNKPHQHALIEREYNILTTLLTSRLQKHSKSPFLWHYRQHLVQLLLPIALNAVLPPSTSLSFPDAEATAATRALESLCHAELQAVLFAAEYHPMNYYSWNYARWFFSIIYTSSLHLYPSLMDGSKPTNHTAPIFMESAIIRKIEKWCFAHASDTSAWTFYQWLLLFYADTFFRAPTDNKLVLSKLVDAVTFATTVSPGHDAVWAGFMRRIIADPRYVSPRRRDQFMDAIARYLRSRKHDSYATQGLANSQGVRQQDKAAVLALVELRDKDVYAIEQCLTWIAVACDVYRQERK